MSAYDVLRDRGVTRLCHFTKLQSLTHILSSENGVAASNSIRQDTKNVTDTGRYDGELDYVCCSIEYPNSWFLDKAQQRNTDQIFREWVVLYIHPAILNRRRAKFCPCNASTQMGSLIRDDIENIGAVFEQEVTARDRTYVRSPRMLSCCSTDGQAEILIKDNIPRDYIIGIAVGDGEIAARVYAMIKTLGIAPIKIYEAPSVLSTGWSALARCGRRPDETECEWPEEE